MINNIDELTDNFVKKYNGKYLDFDGYYGAQCVDLFLYFNKELGNPIIWGDAWMLWDNSADYYDKVDKPQKGDIVIWEKSFGGYGHVAIFISGTKSDFNSFDQNYPIGSVSHIQHHSSYKVQGFLRSKNIESEDLMNREQVAEMFKRYRYDILGQKEDPNVINDDVNSVFNNIDDKYALSNKIGQLDDEAFDTRIMLKSDCKGNISDDVKRTSQENLNKAKELNDKING